MLKPLVRSALVATLILALAGCSAAAKRGGGGTSTASKGFTNPFKASAGKVRRDVAQTQVDLGELESEVKRPR